MNGATILAVDDNPITLKMLRVALEAEDYGVLTSERGLGALDVVAATQIDLVIQHLSLPDVDGLELPRRIRAIPGAEETPIIAFSGLAHLDLDQMARAGFTDYLLKPVEPSRLIRTVELHLGSSRTPDAGRGRHLLLVEDDAVLRKLGALRFRRLGFIVSTANDGDDALALARGIRPDVVVSDVLMPRKDGFKLCLEIRQDAALARIPVVLVSAAFTKEADQQLATRVGANALVTRTTDWDATVHAVVTAMADGAPRGIPGLDLAAGGYTERLVAQLERQLSANTRAMRQLALREAELVVLAGFSEPTTTTATIDGTLEQLLRRSLGAAGAATGVAYLLDADGELTLAAHFGYPPFTDALLQRAFDCNDLLRLVLESGETIAVPSLRVPDDESAVLLGAAGANAMVIAPLVTREERLGVLLMGSRTEEPEWSSFAAALASQIAQAVALTRVFTRLHETEQRLAQVLSASPAVLYVLKRDGAGGWDPAWLSENVVRMVGYTVEEARGTPDWWHHRLHPEDRAQAEAMTDLVFEHGHQVSEYRFRHKDGGYRWLRDELRILPGAGVNGELVGSWVDVTERKQREEGLHQTEKLAAMGQLLAGVAHELNNPLSVVTGQSEMLVRALAGRPEAERAERLDRAAARCGRIVKNFLALARQHPHERGNVSLNRVIAEAADLLAYGTRVDDVRVQLDLAGDLPVLWADAHQLHQVVVNLITNAHHALRDRPAPRCLDIATRFDDAANHVVLTVRDNGPGIPAAIRSRIFEPFFTTKAAGQGTGLGLALCQGIVESHGGTLAVDSEPGEATRFTVTLPRGGRSAPANAEPGVESSVGAGRRVLIVDDEPEVAAILADLLSLDAHHVDVVTSACSALEHLAGDSYDLVFSDMRMPGLDGIGFYAEMARRFPAMARRFAFVTGDALREGDIPDDVARLPKLVKPFNHADVRQMVSVLLGERGRR